MAWALVGLTAPFVCFGVFMDVICCENNLCMNINNGSSIDLLWIRACMPVVSVPVFYFERRERKLPSLVLCNLTADGVAPWCFSRRIVGQHTATEPSRERKQQELMLHTWQRDAWTEPHRWSSPGAPHRVLGDPVGSHFLRQNHSWIRGSGRRHSAGPPSR